MPTTRSGRSTSAVGSSTTRQSSSKVTKSASGSKAGSAGAKSAAAAEAAAAKNAAEDAKRGGNDTDEIVYFWRDTDTKTGWLSQWYQCAFKDDEERVYASAEHYMMYHKAALFSSPIAQDIVSPSGFAMHPREIKTLGRRVKNFEQKVWEHHRLRIVTDGNYFKFKNPVPEAEREATTGSAGNGRKVAELGGLKKMLLDTGEREFVEASPFDAIWGIGMKEVDARRSRGRKQWGLNLLGRALVMARERVRAEELKNEEGGQKEGKGEEKSELDGDEEGEGEKNVKGKGKREYIEEDWVQVDGTD